MALVWMQTGPGDGAGHGPAGQGAWAPAARGAWAPAGRGVGTPAGSLPRPVQVLPIVGTPFAVAVVAAPGMVSGPAVASLVLGIGSVLMALVVAGFGALGAQDGWGPLVAGAFAILAALIAAAALALALIGLARIRSGAAVAERLTGRGMGIAGLACASVGLTATIAAMMLALILV